MQNPEKTYNLVFICTSSTYQIAYINFNELITKTQYPHLAIRITGMRCMFECVQFRYALTEYIHCLLKKILFGEIKLYPFHVTRQTRALTPTEKNNKKYHYTFYRWWSIFEVRMVNKMFLKLFSMQFGEIQVNKIKLNPDLPTCFFPDM